MAEKPKKIKIPPIKPIKIPEIKLPKIDLTEFERIQANLRKLRRLRGF